jgi:CIC family chloride channel protein
MMSTSSGAKAEKKTAIHALSGPVEQEDRLPKEPIQWLGLLVAAGLVGVLVGFIGAAFRWSLDRAALYRLDLIHMARLHVPMGVGWMIPVGACAIAGGIGLWLTQRFAPHSAGSGIPRVEGVLRMHLRPAAGLILPVKFLGGLFAIGCGMALGREGPTVQMGGTVGRFGGDWLRRFVPEPWTLIAAGAGAGLSVAFNAPLAAALFVMEELLHRFSTRVFSATLVACITSTVVLRALLGNATDFSVHSLGTIPADVLPAYLVLGLAAGALGVAFNIALLWSLRMFDHARQWPRGLKGFVVGAAVGLIAWTTPLAVGGGEGLSQFAIAQRIAWGALAGWFIIRFALTMASYGCGAPGGIFAPLLALGALLGNGFATASAHLMRVPAHPAPFAIVAMAALFTAVVRSPLTGVVLLLEMTGGWTLILPMMAASLTAYIIPELAGVPPIYDSLRHRDEEIERSKEPS